MKSDVIWPTETRGGNGAAWLNRLLRACKKAAIKGITVVGGTAKIVDGWIIISVHPSSVGIQWQTPNKELDPRVTVPSGTWVYISALNPLATVGLIDTDSGLLVSAPPGKWLTIKDVPAQATDGTYHVPQLPYPGATGEVSGTPLAGDLDDNPLVYWVLESPAPACFS